jgi:hypothetical protein
LAEFIEDTETVENRFLGVESCLEWRLLTCREERRGEKAAFLGGVFSAHVVFAKNSERGEFSQAVTRKNLYVTTWHCY